MYPLPSDRNITAVNELVTYTNEITQYYFGVLMLVTIFVIIFLVFKLYTTARGFALAIWMTTIIGVLFKILNIINDTVIITLLVLSIVSIPLLFVGGGE